jgi:hypothetical protein
VDGRGDVEETGETEQSEEIVLLWCMAQRRVKLLWIM